MATRHSTLTVAVHTCKMKKKKNLLNSNHQPVRPQDHHRNEKDEESQFKKVPIQISNKNLTVWLLLIQQEMLVKDNIVL